MARTLVAVAALALLAAACREERPEGGTVTPLRLVPIPRHVTPQGPDQPLGEAAIVLPAKVSERLSVAAEEINLRLRELEAPPLRLLTVRSVEEQAFKGRRVELAVVDGPSDGPHPPPEQEYQIYWPRTDRIRLVGREEQGVLWAAVTFCHMLVKRADGTVGLLAASVYDYPDFPLRMMNRLSGYGLDRTERGLLDAFRRGGEPGRYADAYVNEAKQALDFLFRHKLNLTWLPLAGVPTRLDALAQSLGAEEKARLYLATLRRVTDYARARGIAVCEMLTCHLGVSPDDDANPDVARCLLHRVSKKYFCWSNDELNRRRAEQTARLLAGAGYTMAVLQSPDGGGLSDPGGWSVRCQACNARWGDDRAAADAHLLSLWAEAFRTHAPGIALAALPYPADPSILLQHDHPDYVPTVSYWDALRRGLPAGLAICVRESARPAIAAFYALFPRRPVVVQWMTDTTAGEHAWCPLLSSRARFARTFRDGDDRVRRVSVLGISSSSAPLAAEAAAQYLWDAESPGAADWAGDLDVDRDGSQPADFFEKLLPLFVADLFGEQGEKAAPSLLDAFRGCISPSYCLLPGKVARVSETPNTAARMQQQYDALVRACGGLERLWHRLDVGERDAIRPGASAAFCGLSEQVARARVWASFHVAALRAAEGLREGLPRPAISTELAEATARVAADAAIADRMNARVAAHSKADRADFTHWYTGEIQARAADTAYAHLTDALGRLEAVVEGRAIERRESPAAAASARPLLPDDGQSVTLRGKGATLPGLVAYPTQGRSKTSIQVEGLTQPWHDGFSVAFPPVDVSDLAEVDGVLRFYINGGATGNQELTFWLLARDPLTDAAPAEAKDWPHVALADYVAVDALEATWQLVSIPLRRLLPKGYTRVVGFGMNNATEGEVCGPVWLDTMYVTTGRAPVEVEVPVQDPPEQGAATEASVLAVGVQPSTAIGANGPASRLLLGLKVMGNGSLSDVKITLRVLGPDGKLLCTREAVAAKWLRTPWWSPSVRLDLGAFVPDARLDMTLRSSEVNATGSVVVKW